MSAISKTEKMVLHACEQINSLEEQIRERKADISLLNGFQYSKLELELFRIDAAIVRKERNIDGIARRLFHIADSKLEDLKARKVKISSAIGAIEKHKNQVLFKLDPHAYFYGPQEDSEQPVNSEQPGTLGGPGDELKPIVVEGEPDLVIGEQPVSNPFVEEGPVADLENAHIINLEGGSLRGFKANVDSLLTEKGLFNIRDEIFNSFFQSDKIEAIDWHYDQKEDFFHITYKQDVEIVFPGREGKFFRGILPIPEVKIILPKEIKVKIRDESKMVEFIGDKPKYSVGAFSREIHSLSFHADEIRVYRKDDYIPAPIDQFIKALERKFGEDVIRGKLRP